MTYDKELDDELLMLVDKHPHNFVRILISKGKKKSSKNYSHLQDYVVHCTSKLVSQSAFNYKWKTLIYWTLHHITDWNDNRVKCKVCGKSLHRIDVKHAMSGYNRQTCCKECERMLAQCSTTQHMQTHYGVNNAFQIDAVQRKLNVKKAQMQAHRDQTKQKNKTFKTSKQEEAIYAILCNEFGKDNIIRQYKSNVYPFCCDFYVRQLDLYIECNFSWTHGGHWFDETNAEDLKKLQKWKDKGTKYYLNAIETWTVRDLKKKKIAENSNLNYVAFWSLDECMHFIDNLH